MASAKHIRIGRGEGAYWKAGAKSNESLQQTTKSEKLYINHMCFFAGDDSRTDYSWS